MGLPCPYIRALQPLTCSEAATGLIIENVQPAPNSDGGIDPWPRKAKPDGSLPSC